MCRRVGVEFLLERSERRLLPERGAHAVQGRLELLGVQRAAGGLIGFARRDRHVGSWQPRRGSAAPATGSRRSPASARSSTAKPDCMIERPPGRIGAGERLVQRLLQRHVLGDVHRRDREQHHEQRHQQRDHVRVGQQPTLVVLVLGVGSSALLRRPRPPGPAMARPPQLLAAGSRRRCRSPRPPSRAPSAGRTEGELVGDQARVVARLDGEDRLDGHAFGSSTSSDDIAFSLLAIGR